MLWGSISVHIPPPAQTRYKMHRWYLHAVPTWSRWTFNEYQGTYNLRNTRLLVFLLGSDGKEHWQQTEKDLFSKPSDLHNLLYSWTHRQRCKDIIPFNKLLRICRLRSRIKYLCVSMYLVMMSLFLDAAHMARRLDREKLLQRKEVKGMEEVSSFKRICILTYF